MARKSHSHHFIYKTTCIVTNRYYIGMHSTSNMEDGYLGSGKRLWLSIRKHGRETHSIEYIEFLADRSSLKQREKEIITSDMIKDVMCMNLQLGGGGGFINDRHQLKCSTQGGQALSEKLLNDEEFRQHFASQSSKSNKDKPRGAILKPCDWTGKTHSEHSKKLIGEANSLAQKGERNSQFGTVWVKKDSVSKKIKKEECESFLKEGWVRGR